METSSQRLEPLPYHLELVEYLKTHERSLWDWFASAPSISRYTEKLRLDLLKSAYRLDPHSHPEIHHAVDRARTTLQLDIPVTLYQAQNDPQPNAALYFIPGEAHLVFSGPVLSLLSAEELQSIAGHELAHYLLWQRNQGEFHVADRLLQSIALSTTASSSHHQSARRFQLSTEIFADRGSLAVTGNPLHVIAGLIKIQTGLSNVSAPDYLRQSEEIFSKASPATEGVSHPEAFIRARSLDLWHKNPTSANHQIARMIEGSASLDELDLLGQSRWTRITRTMLEQLLRPVWFQSASVLGHARCFFSDFKPATQTDSEFVLPGELDPKLREFLCFVLLDFVTADPALDDLPMAAALQFTRTHNLDAQFEKLAAKELKLKLKDLRALKEQATALLAKAESSP